ncbi:hypothetical protein ES703_47771 [subsurface metagenome]
MTGQRCTDLDLHPVNARGVTGERVRDGEVLGRGDRKRHGRHFYDFKRRRNDWR